MRGLTAEEEEALLVPEGVFVTDRQRVVLRVLLQRGLLYWVPSRIHGPNYVSSRLTAMGELALRVNAAARGGQ